MTAVTLSVPMMTRNYFALVSLGFALVGGLAALPAGATPPTHEKEIGVFEFRTDLSHGCEVGEPEVEIVKSLLREHKLYGLFITSLDAKFIQQEGSAAELYEYLLWVSPEQLDTLSPSERSIIGNVIACAQIQRSVS